MIVKMKKVHFIGLNEQKERFIDRLQEVGVTHITLPMDAAEPTEVSREIQRVTEIRKFLARIKEKGETPEAPSGEYKAICTRREELGQREIRLLGEISTLKKEAEFLKPWGDFNPDDVALLRGKGLFMGFYRVSTRVFDEMTFEDVLIHVTSRTQGEVVFVAVADRAMDLGILEEKLPVKGLSQISREIETKNRELAQIREEYVELSKKVQTLEVAEARLQDDYQYRRVLLNTESALDERLFILTCWSAVSEEELVERIGKDFVFSHFSQDPEEGDRIPVLLSNKTTFDSGEDLVRIYSHPNYKDFDPSGLVLYIFAVFYGMIIGDAGYGLIQLCLIMLLHKKVKSTTPLWIRFRRLSYLLSVSTLFFGVISASYFGVHLDADSPLNKLILLNMGTKEGQNHAMMVSIIMGMVHLSLALAIKLYRTKDLSSLGWLIIMWSGYALLISKMQKGVDNPIATYILIAGFSLVILFTSSAKNWIIRILAGINGAVGVVQLFADVLSYIRLFALGLATMYMCQTFNMLAEMPYKAIPYVGFIPAILILIAGHAINIGLGIMGGAVHGLRLNFLEWYRWCFEGDGLPFKPFRKIATEV